MTELLKSYSAKIGSGEEIFNEKFPTCCWPEYDEI